MNNLDTIPTFEDLHREAHSYSNAASDQSLHEVADLLARYPEFYFQNKESLDFDIPGFVFTWLGGWYAIRLYEEQKYDELRDLMSYMEAKWIAEKERKALSGETSESEMDYFVQFCFLEAIFDAIARSADARKGITEFLQPQLRKRYDELCAAWTPSWWQRFLSS